MLFLTHSFSKWFLCPGHDAVEAVLHLLLSNTNACCSPTQHPLQDAGNAGGAVQQRKAQQERKAEQTHLRPSVSLQHHFSCKPAVPQARAVLGDTIWENLRFLPSKIPARNTISEIP